MHRACTDPPWEWRWGTQIAAVPGRLRNPLRLTRRSVGLGGAASHLGGLALRGSVPRLVAKIGSAGGDFKPPGHVLTASCEKS